MALYSKNKNLYKPCRTLYSLDKPGGGITFLNLPVYTDKYSQDFRKENGKYYTDDPRMKDVVRRVGDNSQILGLDKPPLNSGVPVKSIYKNEKLVGYGKEYLDYGDIKEGQILYYVDGELNKPYFEPTFTHSQNFKKVLYKDPMGSVKPQYNRHPVACKKYGDDCEYIFKSSWIEDTNEHREDIISRQMAKYNSQRYINI